MTPLHFAATDVPLAIGVSMSTMVVTGTNVYEPDDVVVVDCPVVVTSPDVGEADDVEVASDDVLVID